MGKTCPQVSGLSKLLPTLQVLDWQTYYSSRNGLQKILYEKMIYFHEEFCGARIYPQRGRILPRLSSERTVVGQIHGVPDGQSQDDVQESASTT